MEKTYKIINMNYKNLNDNYQRDKEKLRIEFLKYDIISFQEVYDINILKELVNGYNYSYNKGLLLMTKHKLNPKIKVHTNRTCSFLIFPTIHENIMITSFNNFYSDEKIKKEELEDLLEKSNSYTNEYPSILLGDFHGANKGLEEWNKCKGFDIYTRGINVVTCWREVEKFTEKTITHFRI
jgi:hypothetical protein